MDTMCGASSEGFPGTLSQPSYITDNGKIYSLSTYLKDY